MRRANGRKRLTTKFTQCQKESMLEFAQRIGWKLHKRDEKLISEFCSKIGVEKRGFKVWLHNKKKKKNYRRATADVLPECLIDKILSFLSFKEATKMSTLSKTWLKAWLTLSTLRFRVDYPIGNMEVVDNIMERYRNGKIPIEKFELSDYNYDSHKVFPLIDKWLDIALQNGVRDLVLNFTSRSMPIFKILAAKSLRELVLKGCYLMPVSLPDGVVNYSSLRNLSLSFVKLDENKFQTLLNSCPLIVSFILEHCWELKKIKSDSLKVLKIRYCKIGVIDAPNLISLEYMGDRIPKLKIAVESSQLEHSKFVLHCFDYLNDAWFCKLRKFLSNSTSWSQVSINFPRCNVINMKNLQLDHRRSIPQVDVLNVNILSQNEECPTFVDALLWSCHPRRLNLSSTMNKCFLDRLMYMKNSSHSTSHGWEPWHSQLKEAHVYKFDKKSQSWHPVELKRGKLSTRTLSKWEKYFFLLDW